MLTRPDVHLLGELKLWMEMVVPGRANLCSNSSPETVSINLASGISTLHSPLGSASEIQEELLTPLRRLRVRLIGRDFPELWQQSSVPTDSWSVKLNFRFSTHSPGVVPERPTGGSGIHSN